MGVFTPARIPATAKRMAVDQRFRIHILGTILFMICSGCRSTGSLPNFFAKANPDTEPSPIQSVVRAKEVSDLEKRRSKTAANATYDEDESRDGDNTVIARRKGKSVNQVAATRKSADRMTHEKDSTIDTDDVDRDSSDSPSSIENAAFHDERLTSSSDADEKTALPKRLFLENEEPLKIPTVKIPPELPGAAAPQIELPRKIHDDDTAGKAQKLAAIDILFPPRPEAKQIDLPSDRVMSLDQFETIAIEHNPLIAQALANITIVQGAVVQSGVYPNPTFGYESDTVGSSFTKDYQGIYMSQLIKTAGKIPLQRDIANMELMNAQLAYQRTRNEILHSVRTSYFNVLVADEAMRFNGALARLTKQVYGAMVERLKGDEQAYYELAQYTTLLNQADLTLIQSQNQYRAAWKNLAATTGVPGLKPAKLEGRADMPVPNFDYDQLLERIMLVHPDLHASKNLETQSQRNLRLQQVIPIPDVTVAGVFQNDFTTPGYTRTSYNLNVSVPVPIFDRNQGNIRSAQGRLKFSSLQYSAKTNELTNALSDAFNRFQSSRVLVEKYQSETLPNFVRAYKGVYEAHISDNPEVAFGDIIVAQQNLSAGIATYVSSLSMQWSAIFDIGNLLQVEDMRELLPDMPYGSDRPNDIVPAPASEEGSRP